MSSIEVAPDKLTAQGREPERKFPSPGSFTPAKDIRKTEEAARNAFGKLGDTRFNSAGWRSSNPDSLFVPVSQMNELRRQIAADDRETARGKIGPARPDIFRTSCASPHSPSPISHSAFHWSLKVDRINLLKDFTEEDWKDLDEVVVEIAEDPVDALKTLLRQLPRDHVRLALPMITRKWEEKEIADKILELQRAGWTKWEIANISGWNFLKLEAGNLATDWSVYVTNTRSRPAGYGHGRDPLHAVARGRAG